MRVVTAILVCSVLQVFAAPAGAQSGQAEPPQPQTRADALRLEREAKATNSTPNEPDALGRAMTYVEGRGLYLLTRNGFYPKVGSLTTGSGFAFGAGFRNRAIFARRGALEFWGAGSLKRYWAMEARATLPELADHRLMLEAVGGLREYPRESYFGVGPDSRRQDFTSFLLRTSEVTGRAAVKVAPALRVGASVGYLAPRTGRSNSSRLPAIPDVFGEGAASGAPGFGTRPSFVKTSAFFDVDYREPLNARRGGWYRVDFTRYSDRQDGTWTFTRTDVDLQQFIGLFADRRVIALRAYVSSSEAEDGATIPFYLMPSLGGNDTLRGFRNYRFRGPHALLLQAEYRWEIWSGLDAALFYDAGKVGRERSDLGLRGLETDYGFGFRFNTASGVIMRVDAAFGSRDGKHLHIVFGGVF